MKKIVLVCGILAGIINGSWGLVGEGVLKNVPVDTRILFGYATMVLAFSLIFVGIKNYRDNYNGGVISFGKALKVALLITLVASTIYTAAWLIDYFYFIPDFGDKYMAMVRADMVAKGASAAEISKKMAELSHEFTWYKNPFLNALMTYAEIVPVGVVISLIASLILKRKTVAEGTPVDVAA